MAGNMLHPWLQLAAAAQSKSNENVAYVWAQQPNYINKRRKITGLPASVCPVGKRREICNGIGTATKHCGFSLGRGLGAMGMGLALKSAATVTSFVFLFTVLCFLYFVTVNQFCMSDFFTRLRQLYNLLTPSWHWERVATLLRVADAAAAAAAAAASVQKRS